MIGRQGYTPAARRSGQGTVTRLLVYIAGVATVSALAMSPQPAHALFEGNGLYVKGVGAQSVGGFYFAAPTRRLVQSSIVACVAPPVLASFPPQRGRSDRSAATCIPGGKHMGGISIPFFGRFTHRAHSFCPESRREQ